MTKALPVSIDRESSILFARAQSIANHQLFSQGYRPISLAQLLKQFQFRANRRL